VASLLDALASELQIQLSQVLSDSSAVSWTSGPADSTAAELIWWSWSLSIDPACRLLIGGRAETWREICGLTDDASDDDLSRECLARFTPPIEQTAQSRFGSEVTCPEAERADAPPPEWTSASFTITQQGSPDALIQVSVSHDLEIALGVPVEEAGAPPQTDLAPLAAAVSNSTDILMHVEMPVSISLGRTKMRMKDLLHLTNGSVVELDQELADEVEIRVNNCVIAYGEVVAVDGNYAVRVLRMAAARNASDLKGSLPQKVA
jgi:flagellar motor switch protein FliN